MTKEETWSALLEMGAVTGQMPQQRWDLSAIKLIGRNLQKAYLRDVNLHKADLRGADFYKADLRGADLSDALLSRANINRADLYGTNLHRADLKVASLIETDLSTAILTETELVSAVLNGAYLNGANLSGANLSNATLYNASLRSCLLRESALINTNLISADLTGADFTGAMLYNVATAGWKLKGARANYIYRSSELYNPTERDKHKISFSPGQFEYMYGSSAAIDVTIESPLLFDDLFSFEALVRHISRNHAELGLSISGVSISGKLASIRINVSRDDVLNVAAMQLAAGLQSAVKGSVDSERFISALETEYSMYKIISLSENFKMHLKRVSMNLVKQDGSVRSACSEIAGSCMGSSR
ncbi:pentapeptide repeat protein [Candidatus Magnetobacterium bavaricum]|uniref:Pentapeptide repeat protein n=1 Tax=Candidatus Magnetobacterium bavaricum TaxID=29290 RepID=A0A0F3GZT8_9BACT|nr:pentapeptide repeat protein [Candidatus Magnetobacterium bavaricum]